LAAFLKKGAPVLQKEIKMFKFVPMGLSLLTIAFDTSCPKSMETNGNSDYFFPVDRLGGEGT
jgi:hypothetical protein